MPELPFQDNHTEQFGTTSTKPDSCLLPAHLMWHAPWVRKILPLIFPWFSLLRLYWHMSLLSNPVRQLKNLCSSHESFSTVLVIPDFMPALEIVWLRMPCRLVLLPKQCGSECPFTAFTIEIFLVHSWVDIFNAISQVSADLCWMAIASFKASVHYFLYSWT